MPEQNDTTKQPIHFAIFTEALDKLNNIISNAHYDGYWKQWRDVYSLPSGDEWQRNYPAPYWYVETTMFTHLELIDICGRERIPYRDSGTVFTDGVFFFTR